MIEKYGAESVAILTGELLDYSDRLMRAELSKMPAGVFEAEDCLDDDGVGADPLRIAVSVRFEPELGRR